MKRLLTLVVSGVVLAAGSAVQGQTTSPAAVHRAPTRWQGSIGIDVGVPAGEFGAAVPDGAGGLRAHVDRQLGTSIFSLGGEVGWLLYGDDTRKVSLAP